MRLENVVEKENHTYIIVSKIAYLIGVDERFFLNENTQFKKEIYDDLENTRDARTVRRLCVIRNLLMESFRKLPFHPDTDLKSAGPPSDYIPESLLKQLVQDGIRLKKTSHDPVKYLSFINSMIVQNIQKCKPLFPIWIKWEYLEDLLFMPDGDKERGIKTECGKFKRWHILYPYQTYINWRPVSVGNILFNDAKFLTWLYQSNGDKFTEFEMVSDQSRSARYSIHDFILQSDMVDMVIDCENSDPYKAEAVLQSLDADEKEKIQKIILYDDVNTTAVWEHFESAFSIPAERILVNRIKNQKSLVDMSLAIGVCKEFYENQISSFILLSSDSDYWSLISAMPDARFLVVLEEDHTSEKMLDALESSQIPYCWLNDFCIGFAQELKERALKTEVARRLESACRINLPNMIDSASATIWAHFTDTEKSQILNDYRQSLRAEMDGQGNITLVLD